MVRAGKGDPDRISVLPDSLVPYLKNQIDHALLRTVQEVPGHKDVSMTMIFPHVLNRGRGGVRSPPDSG